MFIIIINYLLRYLENNSISLVLNYLNDKELLHKYIYIFSYSDTTTTISK